MAWLSQNWLWIVVAIFVFFLMSRMHRMGHGMGHSMGRGYGPADRSLPPERGQSFGTALDPVSKRAVAKDSAISAVYRGRAYYFENREDRDAFEADPDKYIGASPSAGQLIGTEDASRERARRRRGCC